MPGFPLDPRAEGTNALLRAGATLIRDAGDVLEVIGAQIDADGTRDLASDVPPSQAGFATTPRPALPETAGSLPASADDPGDLVLRAIGPEPVEIDDLVMATGLGASAVRIALMELELTGQVARHGASRVSRADA